MDLLSYKKEIGLSYRKMSEQTGIPHVLLQRACENPKYCLKAQYCYAVIQWSDNKVTLEDLIGEC